MNKLKLKKEVRPFRIQQYSIHSHNIYYSLLTLNNIEVYYSILFFKVHRALNEVMTVYASHLR